MKPVGTIPGTTAEPCGLGELRDVTGLDPGEQAAEVSSAHSKVSVGVGDGDVVPPTVTRLE